MALCRLATALIGFMFALHVPGFARADLAIEIQSPTATFADPATFELSVTIQNRGEASIVVLPQRLRRAYSALGSGSATYSPHPGPPMAPWNGAFALRPGQSRTLTYVGMDDGDGHWRIEPGRYALRVRLGVSSEFAGAAEAHVAHFGAVIWQGDIQSSAIVVTYEPPPAT